MKTIEIFLTDGTKITLKDSDDNTSPMEIANSISSILTGKNVKIIQTDYEICVLRPSQIKAIKIIPEKTNDVIEVTDV